MPTKPLSPAELATIKAVWATTTPGTAEQWGLDATIRLPDGSRWILGDAEYHPGNMALARTYAAAPSHIAALLDEVERLRGAIVEYHRIYDSWCIGGAGNATATELKAAEDVLRGIAGEA